MLFLVENCSLCEYFLVVDKLNYLSKILSIYINNYFNFKVDV